MTDLIIVKDAERIERTDVEAMASTGRDWGRQFASGFLTNPSGQQAWILSGFAMSNPSAKLLQVTRGVAILAARERGQIVTGTFTSEGNASLTPDLAGYANGTYGVYIRFETADGSFENRVFWDPVAGAEFSQSVPVKRFAGWGVAVTLTSPGGEWFKIGTVTVSASPPLVLDGQRQFYFEGTEAGGTYSTGWGAGNDRNADRALYGVHDLRTFVAAMVKKVEELQSNTARWWSTTAEPLDKKVSRVGDLTLDGNYRFNGAGHNVQVDGTAEVDGLLTTAGGLHSGAGSNIGTNTDADGRYSWLYARDIHLKDAQTDILMAHTGNLSNINMEKSGTPSKFFKLWYDSTLNTNGTASVYTNYRMELGIGGTEKLRITSADVLVTHGPFMPAGSKTQDLGGSGNIWADCYVDNLYACNKIEPATTGIPLGASSKRWDAFVNDLDIDGNVTGNLIPQGTSGVRTVGDLSHRWDGFFDSLQASAWEADLVPAGDDLAVLGDNTHRWQKITAHAVRAGTVGTALGRTYSLANMSGFDHLYVDQSTVFRGAICGGNTPDDTVNRMVSIICNDTTAVLNLDQGNTGGKVLSVTSSDANDNSRPISTKTSYTIRGALKIVISGSSIAGTYWVPFYDMD